MLRHTALILAAGAGLSSTAVAQVRPATRPASDSTPATAPSTQGSGDRGDFVEGLEADGKLHLLVGRSAVLTTRTPYKRVLISNPEVLSDIETTATGILLRGNNPGKTQMAVWDDNDRASLWMWPWSLIFRQSGPC